MGCGAVVGAIALGPVTGAAQAQTAPGVFNCRASALKAPILGEPVVANAGYSPCRDEQTSRTQGLGIGGLLGVFVIDARTGTDYTKIGEPAAVGGYAWASVAYANVTLPGVKLNVWGLSSTAGRKCIRPGEADIGGSTAIASIQLNGRTLPVSLPLRIPLGIATIYTNYAVKTSDSVTTRAVWVDLAGDANDIILAEARGGSTGTVC